MIDLLTHLLHNDHGERSLIVAFLADALPHWRVWLATWRRS